MTLSKEDLQALSDMMDAKLDAKLRPMKADMESMKSDMQGMKNQIAGIELHLENTTDAGIKFIAEGHLDLSRRLNEALESAQERESLLVRVSYLESSVRKLNGKYAETS